MCVSPGNPAALLQSALSGIHTDDDVQPGTAARGGITLPKNGWMLPRLRGSPGAGSVAAAVLPIAVDTIWL